MDNLKRALWGVDFSGAKLAGEKIWLAKAYLKDGSIEVELLLRADELPHSSLEREVALAALVTKLESESNAVVGLDFPFSLEKSALEGKNYLEFLHQSADFSSSSDFREAFSGKKRRTDFEGKTPFSPLNLRLFRQTFHGIRDVLRPLVNGGAHVIPMMETAPDKLWLLEICPASLLKKEKLYFSYKGKSELQRENRARILQEIKTRFSTITGNAMDERAIADTEGDALDAILAVVSVALALKTPQELRARDAIDEIEGRVYF